MIPARALCMFSSSQSVILADGSADERYHERLILLRVEVFLKVLVPLEEAKRLEKARRLTEGRWVWCDKWKFRSRLIHERRYLGDGRKQGVLHGSSRNTSSEQFCEFVC